MHRIARLAAPLALLAVLAAQPAAALDFRSVGDNAAVLYDAPSAKARRLYVVNRGYPVEVVVVVEGWVKIRDASGDFAWIESKALTDRRTVVVKMPLAAVRQKPDETAPIVFRAEQNVILELLDVAGSWLRVKHRDGPSGFIKVSDIWGA